MKIAVVQLNTRDDKQENLRKTATFIEQAAESGAELVSLPEYFNFMGPESEKPKNAEQIPSGETTTLLCGLAKKHGIYIHAGSILEEYTAEKSYNTSLMIGPDGEVLETYRKIHLFDIGIEGQATYKESDTVQSGDTPVFVDLPVGKAGLSICYDLRFPELFRNYALNGAKVLFIPAAFTLYTGMLHWEVLLRARAIENQCYVIAAGQFGTNQPGKACYGNSMIIDPWGTVIARSPEGEGFVIADIDGTTVEKARESIPCLNHRRPKVY
ncbi:carbon-nitrogen hydrolase family protein [Sporosarcina sp. CAU 1771]